LPISTALVAGVAVDTRHWIGGRRVASPATFTDVSPIDGEPIAEVARGGAAEVDAAVEAARAAFRGWAAVPPSERAAVLRAIAAGVRARIEDLAQVETRDNGSLLRSHRRSVMPRVARNFEFFADWLGHLDPGDREVSGHAERVSWDPSGVTAVITPWNAPLMLATWRIAPALAAGAHPLLGGAANPDLGGLYYQPTLLGGAAPGAEILTDEVFGPVLTLQTFASEAEAVALANSTRYGLAATVFTGDKARAERVSARLVAGTVWVNCFFVRDLAAPFGGAGLSGIGREGGTWSFDFYSDVKNTVYAGQG
jgi:acyl-CoA reductase-like NAD-dependent aldehyde dehydrogenase